jgi:hypothetical protein
VNSDGELMRKWFAVCVTATLILCHIAGCGNDEKKTVEPNATAPPIPTKGVGAVQKANVNAPAPPPK